MARLGDMGSDTSDTSEKNKRYQEKPIVHAGCTPDTSDTSQFAEPPKPAQIDQGGLSTGTCGQLAGKNGDGLAVVRNDRQKLSPKLADAGISKALSSRAQKLAAVPEAEVGARQGGR